MLALHFRELGDQLSEQTYLSLWGHWNLARALERQDIIDEQPGSETQYFPLV